MQRLWLMRAVTGSFAASPVGAQDVSPPRFQLGGIFSGTVPVVFDDGPTIVLGVGPRVTFNLTSTLGLDVMAEVVGPIEYSGTLAVYQSQLNSKSRDGKTDSVVHRRTHAHRARLSALPDDVTGCRVRSSRTGGRVGQPAADR